MADLPRLTDDQIIYTALEAFARRETLNANAYDVAEHLRNAQRARELAEAHRALERHVDCPHCGHRWPTTSRPAECPRCRQEIDEAA